MNDFLDQNNFILTELTSSSMGRIRGEWWVPPLYDGFTKNVSTIISFSMS